jgi:3-deoxy-D-manno-octulosonic-acid transferase
MNIYYITYILLSTLIFLLGFPFLFIYGLASGRHIKGLNERLGFIRSRTAGTVAGSPHIWMHAASLGETRVAEAIIGELKRLIPGCSITLSTMTEHGKNLAAELFGKDVNVIYSPFDILPFVRTALKRLRPDVLIFVETEIWPVWISEARRMGIKIALLNGRISQRSFKRYLRLRPLFRHILSKIDSFSMISEDDKNRITAIGADPARTVVNGNAKFDLLADLADPSIPEDMRRLFSLKEGVPLLIAGSTRSGEEAMIIDAYKRIIREFPETLLFIAPRHIERAKEIASLLEKNKLEYQFRNELKDPSVQRNRQVVIVDTFGELFRIYSIGTIIICGGSLVPLGGQNPLEPAAWGKPVIFGPFMENFPDARDLLKTNNACIEISSPEMLAEKSLMLLKDRVLIEGYGLRARDSVFKNRKVAERHAKAIADIMTGTH